MGFLFFIFTRILSIDLLKLQEKDFIKPLYTCNFNYTQTKPNVCFDKIVSSRFRYGRPPYVLSHAASEIHVVLAPFCLLHPNKYVMFSIRNGLNCIVLNNLTAAKSALVLMTVSRGCSQRQIHNYTFCVNLL